MVEYCPSCGAKAEQTSKFCKSCGSSLDLKTYESTPIESTPIQPKTSSTSIFNYLDWKRMLLMIILLVFAIGLISAVLILMNEDQAISAVKLIDQDSNFIGSWNCDTSDIPTILVFYQNYSCMVLPISTDYGIWGSYYINDDIITMSMDDGNTQTMEYQFYNDYNELSLYPLNGSTEPSHYTKIIDD